MNALQAFESCRVISFSVLRYLWYRETSRHDKPNMYCPSYAVQIRVVSHFTFGRWKK